MPLPDERPRQSVANLIGRFEQQGKRQASPATPVVPRSSSVSSQVAGDSAKEDAKAKRDWPPKSVASTDDKPVAPTSSASSSPSMSKSPALSPQPSADAPPPASLTPTPTPAHPEPTKSPPPKGNASTPTTGMRRAPLSPVKSRTSAASTNSPVKSPVRSPPQKTSLQPSVSQPLRPQHTGQSTTSNASTARATRTVLKTAPSTPSRPKTPGTQTQGISRPKTPSTGLFAPTAASLARSRHALPPPPPATRKVTPSSDVAERLSKPTAASLSKARTPTSSAPSPARVAKSASSGATPRAALKLRVGLAPTRTKAARGKEAAMSAAASGASPSSQPSHEPEDPAGDHAENGHELEEAVFSDGGVLEDVIDSEVTSDVTHDDSAAVSELAEHRDEVLSQSEVHPEQPVDVQPAEGVTHVEELVTQEVPEEQAAHGEGRINIYEEEVAPDTTELHVEEVVSNGDDGKVELLPNPTANDIEHIVNLLEGTSLSKTRPQSIVSIPDEEITDEY